MDLEALTTEDDLARAFGVSVRTIQRDRIRNEWPRIRVGKSFRFTPDQVAEILLIQSRREAETAPSGQTSRSAKRTA